MVLSKCSSKWCQKRQLCRQHDASSDLLNRRGGSLVDQTRPTSRNSRWTKFRPHSAINRFRLGQKLGIPGLHGVWRSRYLPAAYNPGRWPICQSNRQELRLAHQLRPLLQREHSRANLSMQARSWQEWQEGGYNVRDPRLWKLIQDLEEKNRYRLTGQTKNLSIGRWRRTNHLRKEQPREWRDQRRWLSRCSSWVRRHSYECNDCSKLASAPKRRFSWQYWISDDLCLSWGQETSSAWRITHKCSPLSLTIRWYRPAWLGDNLKRPCRRRSYFGTNLRERSDCWIF